MGSVINCTGCNQKINATPQMMGQPFACPLCKTPIIIDPEFMPEIFDAQFVPDEYAGAADDSATYRKPGTMAEAYRHYSQIDAMQAAAVEAPEPQSRTGLWVLGLLGCGGLLLVMFTAVGLMFAVREIGSAAAPAVVENLLEAREGFETQLTTKDNDGTPAPNPPQRLFSTVSYESPLGPMTAYLGRPNDPTEKHPAIIWLFGGFSNGIGETAWEDQPADNDQSASAFREQGIVMMYPSLRGGNDNPGHIEACFGEVEDVLAAAEFLAEQDFVDPQRIYLGGHSTGGTLALLCAASTEQFRAVFSLGPVDDIRGYGQDVLPFSIYNSKEARFRNPINWLGAIKNPTFVFEGSGGNAPCVRSMKYRNRNEHVQFLLIGGEDHFSIIQPLTRLLAEKITNDNDVECNIAIDPKEL